MSTILAVVARGMLPHHHRRSSSHLAIATWFSSSSSSISSSSTATTDLKKNGMLPWLLLRKQPTLGVPNRKTTRFSSMLSSSSSSLALLGQHTEWGPSWRSSSTASSSPPLLSMLQNAHPRHSPPATTTTTTTTTTTNNRWSPHNHRLSIHRFFHTTTPPSMPLSEFRDAVPRAQRAVEPVGRAWRAKELRRKSYDDLHKLWYVLYKERNMLLTEQQLSRRKNIPFPQPQRMVKVRKGMGAIRQVLGERKRLHLKTLSMERSSDKTDSKDSNEQPQPAEFSGESIATPPPSPN